MQDEIIEVDDLADPDRTFSRFDLTNRLSIWKLLSTQEKDKLKEAYEKGDDSSVQVWTGQNDSNSVSFNDIRSIVKGLTLQGNVIDAYTKNADVRSRHLHLWMRKNHTFSAYYVWNDYGIIVCFIMKQLVRHLDVDKSMRGESCKTMQAGMVKSFVNDRRRSFVASE
ncbi:hypothetical protein LOK49_LG04G03559 [Camellia lanceoleosa]|uniref:Uncharacterized protein n=1 Tax=Camellia lanceoleosa TaxID=1840588 RepID=A0ACC0I2T2_9ERIC|nr:hypothetical protein LOK49_LG04G03559 [Camellia lanceoleosa]